MPTYEDIAFKVIVKNDGISDIIFKTLMLKGEAGGTISSIEKTSSVGVVDTYTITLNDGTTSTFEVTNGSNIESIEKTATAGLIDTYTVTLTNGDTSTFEVKNGEDAQLYELPKNCVVGYDKEPTQVTERFVDRYIMLNNVNGISSVKYNGSTLQETNDGRNLGLFSEATKDNSQNGTYNFENGGFNWEVTGNYSRIGFTFDVTVGETYTISFRGFSDANLRRVEFSDSASWNVYSYGNLYLTNEDTSYTKTITATSNILFIGFYLSTNVSTGSATITNFQLEKGSQATAYRPYCGGIPAPNPSYPKEIVGVGDKQQDNTYSVDLVAEDSDGNVYTVTASGLTHPVYSGDWIDLVAGKLHRANGHVDLGSLSWVSESSVVTGLARAQGSGIKWQSIIFCENFIYSSATSYSGVNNGEIALTNSESTPILRIRWEDWGSYSDAQIKTALDGVIAIYKLTTPTEESITLTGDLEQVKRIRGEYAYIDAPLYASTDITFGQDIDFPDGYEEIDFPLDDLFYYQDQEFIEFPTSWGFVMGYVFDASEIRFTMNVTKELKQGFSVVANKSIDLALNLYTGAGGDNLTGFNFVDASFIREYGQIQIRLKTENPHGLAVGSLLGARVSQGRLRITFEEET